MCAWVVATVPVAAQPVLSNPQSQPRAAPPPPPPGTTRPVPATQKPVPRAPVRRGPQWRGSVAAGASWQPGTSSFTERRSETVFRETATTIGEYELEGAVGIDVGGVLRLWRNLGIGLAVTALSRPGEAAFSLSSPHPFFFNRPRTATTAAADLDRTETGVHLSAAYHIGGGGRWRVSLFGGPSFYAISQPVVDMLVVTDAYPYDTITAAPGQTSDQVERAIGFHVGGDVSWYFSRRVGAGALVRYANAEATTSINGGADVTLTAGGAQVGLGLRLRF
jgi:hypothetical protein